MKNIKSMKRIILWLAWASALFALFPASCLAQQREEKLKRVFEIPVEEWPGYSYSLGETVTAEGSVEFTVSDELFYYPAEADQQNILEVTVSFVNISFGEIPVSELLKQATITFMNRYSFYGVIDAPSGEDAQTLPMLHRTEMLIRFDLPDLVLEKPDEMVLELGCLNGVYSFGIDHVEKIDAPARPQNGQELSPGASSPADTGAWYGPDTLSISQIPDNNTRIDAIPDAFDAVPALSPGYFTGAVSFDGQKNDHSFTPAISGTYRFEFQNIADGVDFRLWVCRSNGDSIKSDYDMDDGDGLTVSLQAGTTYIIRVGQYRNYGAYSLLVGEQKPTFDISPLTMVTDSVQYTDQENNYRFTAALNGTYRFEFKNVPDGTDFRLYVYNSGWETIKSDYDMDNGDGLTVSLQAGKSYYIRVKQYRSLGGYSLLIGKQKPIADVSQNTLVSDSIQFTDQRNSYALTAALNGTYRFEFANVPEGTDLRLYVYNSGWETIKSDYDMDSGDGLTVSLNAGQAIYLTVVQYRKTGSYDLLLGKPKPVADITRVKQVMDSVQVTDQRNSYAYEAQTAGKHMFSFSDVADGVDYRMQIYNSGWESLKSDYDMDSGDGLTVELAQGQKIYIVVGQYRNFGTYTLNVS